MRADEFGGVVKPRDPKPGANYFAAAEIFPEDEWIYTTDSFIDLAEQLRQS